MAELAGKSASIKISGAATSFTGEATTTDDNQNYQITSATKRVWDRATTPTVLDDGIATTESYTVNKLTGTITFATVDALRGVVTVTGKYLPMTTATYAHEFSYNRGVDLMEVNKFGDTHKACLAGTKFASGTLSQWDVTSEYFADALTAGNPVVIEFLYEIGADPIRVWALLESNEMQAAIGNPQDNIVSFISTDELLDN